MGSHTVSSTPYDTKFQWFAVSLILAQRDIPYGGAKGGMICGPKQLSPAELERLTRRYTTEISILLGPAKDIPAPDVNTIPLVMAWIVDTFSMHHGYTIPAVVTGKPINIGGSHRRNEATARGTTIVIGEAARQIGLNLEGAKVAIQGYRNAGSIAAQLLHDLGAVVIAVSDSRGGIYKASGLDPSAVLRCKHSSVLIPHLTQIGAWGDNVSPNIPFSAPGPGVAGAWRRKERFLEGLQPSKPRAWALPT
jgi:glutamate dehydrogenase/leucine dehydrogenase